MATGEKWTAQAVATSFDSGDIMSIVQSGTNKQVDHDILMDDTQICKAWVNFNGTGVIAERDSFNVSSLVDNGTGDYTINFTNALTDANYSATFGADFAGSSSSVTFGRNVANPGTTTQLRCSNIAGGVAADNVYLDVQIFGS